MRRNLTHILTSILTSKGGRWGEAETEKGPVDLFPAEPTDEARNGEEKVVPRDSQGCALAHLATFAE